MSDSYRVRVKRAALKSLQETPAAHRRQILELLDVLALDPFPVKSFHLVKLRGEENAYRVGEVSPTALGR